MLVLRFQVELEKGNVDLVYFDYLMWINLVNDNKIKYYSVLLIDSLVGMFVKVFCYGQDISWIRKFVIVFGFFFLYWQDRIDSGKIKFIFVVDNKVVFYFVQLDWVDVVDMDYYVVNYLLSKLFDVDDFVFDFNLLVIMVEFCLLMLNNLELVVDISEFIVQYFDVVVKLKV